MRARHVWRSLRSTSLCASAPLVLLQGLVTTMPRRHCRDATVCTACALLWCALVLRFKDRTMLTGEGALPFCGADGDPRWTPLACVDGVLTSSPTEPGAISVEAGPPTDATPRRRPRGRTRPRRCSRRRRTFCRCSARAGRACSRRKRCPRRPPHSRRAPHSRRRRRTPRRSSLRACSTCDHERSWSHDARTHRAASKVTQHASASLGHVWRATPSTKFEEWAFRSESWARPTWHCKAVVLVMQARASRRCPMARCGMMGFVACVACRGSDGFVRWAARHKAQPNYPA